MSKCFGILSKYSKILPRICEEKFTNKVLEYFIDMY